MEDLDLDLELPTQPSTSTDPAWDQFDLRLLQAQVYSTCVFVGAADVVCSEQRAAA